MTHDFSVQIHTFLKEKIDECEQTIENSDESNESETIGFQSGRQKEFVKIRKMISHSMDLST